MYATIFRSALLVAALTLAFNATAAQRTFVSTSGSDANTASNCSNTAPCRGFGAALTVTDSGGEIIVLSSGGYGPVTIDKSVSIIAPEGIYAGISVFSGNGITIATAGVEVVLRGLTINGLGGSNGVIITAGDSLMVQNCTARNFTSAAISVGSNAKVQILDSLLQGNFHGTLFSASATAIVSRSRMLGNSYGIYVYSDGSGVPTKVEVNHSEALDNTYGFRINAINGGKAQLNIKDSVASRNASGVNATSSSLSTTFTAIAGSLISGNSSEGLAAASGSGSKLVASGNTITNNATGLSQGGAAILQSTGDNTLSGNTADTSGTISSLAKL